MSVCVYCLNVLDCACVLACVSTCALCLFVPMTLTSLPPPAVSWLPIHCVGVVIDFLRPQQLATHGDLLFLLHSYALWLGHANSAINPVCYYVMNCRFRSAVRRQLHSMCCCVRPPVLRRERRRERCLRVEGRIHNETSIKPVPETRM